MAVSVQKRLAMLYISAVLKWQPTVKKRVRRRGKRIIWTWQARVRTHYEPFGDGWVVIVGHSNDEDAICESHPTSLVRAITKAGNTLDKM